METISIVQEVASLPPAAQKQVVDFISFLKTRYPTAQVNHRVADIQLIDEPFIGMWRDREEM